MLAKKEFYSFEKEIKLAFFFFLLISFWELQDLFL